eukprot:9481986-Pyramimonas_sp.AAC.1
MKAMGIAMALPTDMTRSLAAHLADPAQLGGNATLSNVAFADDGTLLILCPAASVVLCLERLLVLAADSMARRGQVLNYNP